MKEETGSYRMISVERHSLSKEEYKSLNDEYWFSCDKQLQPVEIVTDGLVEDFEGTLMTSKYIKLTTTNYRLCKQVPWRWSHETRNGPRRNLIHDHA